MLWLRGVYPGDGSLSPGYARKSGGWVGLIEERRPDASRGALTLPLRGCPSPKTPWERDLGRFAPARSGAGGCFCAIGED
jgi:hypothetical protein